MPFFPFIVFGWIGLVLFLLKLFRSFFNIFYPFFIGRPRNLFELVGDARWALVTGATDGIGKAYAAELARRGFNLVLISRSAAKLDSVSEELKQSVGREAGNDLQIRTVQFDFTNAKLADYEERVFPHLNDIDIGILVNNVGMLNDYPERLHRSPDTIKQNLNVAIVNTLPATLLSTFVLPQMARRGRGAIVNISSAAAFCHWYYYAVYSTAKKYIVYLSSVLRDEYVVDAPGVHIQAVCPMLVATKMASRTKGRPSFLVPSPDQFAKQALRTVGLATETTGCFIHQIQAEILFNYIPGFIFNALMCREALKTRARALLVENKNY